MLVRKYKLWIVKKQVKYKQHHLDGCRFLALAPTLGQFVLLVASMVPWKSSLEPDLNQWPKDISIYITATVLRSTNWAIEGAQRS